MAIQYSTKKKKKANLVVKIKILSLLEHLKYFPCLREHYSTTIAWRSLLLIDQSRRRWMLSVTVIINHALVLNFAMILRDYRILFSSSISVVVAQLKFCPLQKCRSRRPMTRTSEGDLTGKKVKVRPPRRRTTAPAEKNSLDSAMAVHP
jgi:hypothetical protein